MVKIEYEEIDRPPFYRMVGSPAQTKQASDIVTLGEYINAGRKSNIHTPAMQVVHKAEKMREALDRIDPEKLEASYIREPLAFSGVNLYVRTFLSAEYEIVCNNSREEKILSDFRDDSRFDTEIIPKIVQDMCTFGASWNEILYSGKTLVGVDYIDPKSMDFLRDSLGKILYDQYNQPTGYVQYVSFGSKAAERKDVLQQFGKFAIPIPKEYILHIPLFTVGANPHGIGIIEPMYNNIIIKQNIQKAWGQNMYNLGFPIRVVKVGDQVHHATPAEIKEIADAMEDADERSLLVIPNYYDISYLETKKSGLLKDELSFFIDEQVSVTGAPKALVTGSGESTNRSTLQNQQMVFMRNIKFMQKRVSRYIEDNIFRILAKQHNFKSIPRFNYEDVLIESLSDKSKRLNTYVKHGLLTASPDVEAYIRKLENLPELSDEEREKIKKEAKPIIIDPKEEEDEDDKEEDEEDEDDKEISPK